MVYWPNACVGCGDTTQDKLKDNRYTYRHNKLINRSYTGTYGGAKALGISEELGSLARGKAATFLAVESGPIGNKDVLEFLVHEGCRELGDLVIG